MRFDDELIEYLEGLSCLALPDGEKSRMLEDLQALFSLVSILEKLPAEGAGESSNPIDTINVFRDDKVLPSFKRELILKNAPYKTDEMIIAPKTVE